MERHALSAGIACRSGAPHAFRTAENQLKTRERCAKPTENACRSIERHAFSAGIACRSIERHAKPAGNAACALSPKCMSFYRTPYIQSFVSLFVLAFLHT